MDTPAMRQYRSFKEQYPDCILLFRMGDFYEMFYEDAKTASREPGLALTSRWRGPAAADWPEPRCESASDPWLVLPLRSGPERA